MINLSLWTDIGFKKLIFHLMPTVFSLWTRLQYLEWIVYCMKPNPEYFSLVNRLCTVQITKPGNKWKKKNYMGFNFVMHATKIWNVSLNKTCLPNLRWLFEGLTKFAISLFMQITQHSKKKTWNFPVLQKKSWVVIKINFCLFMVVIKEKNMWDIMTQQFLFNLPFFYKDHIFLNIVTIIKAGDLNMAALWLANIYCCLTSGSLY